MGALSLRELIQGYRVTQVLHVAAALRIPDLLADGPRSSDDLAEASGAHAPTLYRFLRALAAVGAVEEQDDRRFALTPLGEELRGDLGDWAMLSGSEIVWSAWGQLLHSVRTGENGFRHAYGTDIWSYRETHPDQSEIFDRAMTANTRAVAQAVVDAYDFSRFATVADIAGGRGALITAIVDANPEVRGILFDRQHVVEHADVGDRVTVAAGSFFEEVPADADAYVLKDIIHDWEDPEAVRILQVVRVAMKPGSVLLVLERDLDTVEAKFTDLTMLVAPGGRERSTAEYEQLFAEAGLGLCGVTPTSTAYVVFEAESIQEANARSK